MHRLLGIDAGKSVVRAVLIRTAYRRVFVEALGEVAVTDGLSEAEAIRAAVGLHRPDGAAIALSGERSFYRRLDLPAAAQKEVENILGFELEATVPFEMEDAVFDYRMLKRPHGVETLPVFAAVARADDVRERIAVVKEALGFEPERVALGAVALANLEAVMPELAAPPTTGASGPIAILDLDYLTSEIVILSGGEPVFARTLSRGTAGLPGTAPALARELRQTLAAWRNLGGEPLAGLYLVGGGATAQGAELFLSTQLGLTILPLPTPRLEGLTPEQAAALPRFAKALGLALGLTPKTKGFNLRKGALEAERSYPFLREKIPILAGLGTVIALSFGFSVVAEMRTLDAERELLLASLATASRDVLGEETSDPVKARELLDQGPGAADEDPMPRVDAFDVMVQLSKAVPKEIVHDVLELDVNRGHTTIQGVVPSVSDAQIIADHMKEHRCFRDVKIARTSQFTEGRHKYVLELDLKCEDKKKKKTGAADAVDSAAAGAADKPEGSR
ncbi:type IV pilus biogenesis protein PilM [Sorangium cellulosum]|uniref:General secretion pathway protein GspL n=1 Tax=Sorangium cellulosum TaxID=56 RepID=A0A150QN21_SORCE|nr:pilus assembly protein PilM [Sorangium cellulosum]KYF69370.1 general secretion pathway protein GspL [Sorangium cellulosum]